MEKRNHGNDITEGPLFRSLLTFFIPIFMGSLLQQSYNFIDAIIIGRYTGANGLAAIDATYNYTKLLIHVFLSIALGGSILISQYMGAKKLDAVKKVVHVLFTFSFSSGLIITVVGMGLAPLFSKIMNVPAGILDMCVNYLRIYFMGTVFSFLFNIATGVLRAVGDTKTPFIYLMIGSAINITLDFVFVAGFKWGVSGAAVATVISQAIVCLLVIKHLMNRNDAIRLEFSRLRYDKKILNEILKVGLPMGGQSSFYVVSNMMVQRGINAFGVLGIAAWSLCGKMDFIIWLWIEALGTTVTTFVAQNYGASNQDRMHCSVKYGFGFLTTVIGIMSFILYVFVPIISGWFTTDSAVISETTKMMRLIAPYYVLPGLSQIMSGAIKGRGETLKPMILALLGTGVVRVLWIIVALPLHPSPFMAVLSYPISWGITVVLFLILWLKINKEHLFQGLATDKI